MKNRGNEGPKETKKNPFVLLRRDFMLMVAGQVVSLFGNAILRFSLSLYVLELTGSAAAFGGITALAPVPSLLFGPLGGVLADRVPRQRIMAGLDFATAGLVALFGVFGAPGRLAVIAAVMMLLALIQAFYQPAVQASIPGLAGERLMEANGVVIQVQALASLLGPILGGFLYGIFGVVPIVEISAVCFLLSAVMELFLRIPFERQPAEGSAVARVAGDLAEAARFLAHGKPDILHLLIVVAGMNLFLSALFVVGLPFLVKVRLGLSSQAYGFAEAALGLGSILGGMLSGFASRRVSLERSHLFLLATCALLLPVAAAIALAPPMAAYGVLLVCVTLGMGAAALFNIAAQTFIQRQTPDGLLGKVGAFISVICVCAMPVGQALYGVLFEAFRGAAWAVVLLGCAASLVLVRATKRTLQSAVDH